MEKELKKLLEEQSKDDFWLDKEEANKKINQMNELKVIVDPIQQLSKRVENNLTTLKALTEE